MLLTKLIPSIVEELKTELQMLHSSQDDDLLACWLDWWCANVRLLLSKWIPPPYFAQLFMKELIPWIVSVVEEA